jgi:predicted RNA binding protein YcfA (HicA-like mRNA interferase family)
LNAAYRERDGNTLSVPVHSKDIGKGLEKKILKEAKG